MQRSKLGRLVGVLLVLTLLAAACGRSGDNSSNASGKTTTTAAGNAGGVPAKVPGFDGTTIKLGVITPLTGVVSIIGNPLTNGDKVWFDHVNAAGGIGGKYKIDLDIQDSAYDASTAVQLYTGMKDSVVMLAQLLGTGPVQAVLPKLKADNIVAQPATLDAFWVREQNLLPIGAPYQIQVINGMDYYMNNGGKGKTICWIGTDDPYGDAGLEGMKFAADKLGFTIAAQPRFATADTDYTAQIGELKSKGCQGVFGTYTAASISGVLSEAVKQGFEPQWILQSPSWLELFAGGDLKDYLMKHVWIVSEGPAWGDTSAPAMQGMLDDVAKYAPDQKPDGYFAFGYIGAKAVTQLLEAAVKAGDLSHEGIINAMNSIKEFDLGGLLGQYGWGKPEDRDPPRANTIFGVDPAKPVGLTLIKADVESDAADAYEFPTK